MREFNIFGPIYPDIHYHVDRVAVKAALRERIDRGRYITLNAGRQTGKTTIFRETIAEAEASGDYFGILLDFEVLAKFSTTNFYEELGYLLENWRKQFYPSVPSALQIRHHGDFTRWLRSCVSTIGKKGVLMIDEFDAVSNEIIEPILSQFRGMYLDRKNAQNNVVHSILLVGVRNLPALLKGTQSPFNIADQFTVPYFTPAEVADLLGQHTAETGQPFTKEVIEAIVQESAGQPFLVNRLGQMLTQEIVQDRSQSITRTDLDYALTKLLHENNSHFYSILSKAKPHQQLLLPILLYSQSRTDFMGEATQELIMYGVLRVMEGEDHLPYARIANPIYHKMLLLRFTAETEPLPINGVILHRYLRQGFLDFDALLDHFKAFMQEHGVRLLKSAKTGKMLEISGQYLLLSYLEAALNTIQGHVTIESVSSAGEIDILAFHRGQRFIIETKIWYDKTHYEEGKKQLARYLHAAGLSKGYLMIFDEALTQNPIVKEEAKEVFEVTVDEKTLRVYWIGVEV